MRDSLAFVVPTLGTREEWLRRCLESVQRQNEPRLRLVLVGPPTSTLVALAHEFDANLVVDPGKGLSAAISAGWLAYPDSEYITWLGDDDLLTVDSVSKSLQALSLHPDAPYSYGSVRVVDESDQTIFVMRPGRFGPLWQKVGRNWVPQPGSILRREAVERVGGLDDELRNSMDLDLLLKLGSVGKPLLVRSEVALYRVHKGAITSNKGAADEAEEVRTRHLSAPMQRRRTRLRPAIKAIDKVIYRVFVLRSNASVNRAAS